MFVVSLYFTNKTTNMIKAVFFDVWNAKFFILVDSVRIDISNRQASELAKIGHSVRVESSENGRNY